MVSIRIDLAEAKKIEREAQRILKAKAAGVSTRKVTGTKESREYAKKLQKLKELTGKKRLSYDQKKALHSFTAKQVLKRIDVGSKTYARRLKAFEKSYGTADEQTRYVLEYLTPKATAKKLEIEAIDTDDGLEEATFSEVSLPKKTWNDLPTQFKKWSHKSGNYMYENADILWLDSSADKIDMQKLFEMAEKADGDDHTNYDFFNTFTNELWGGTYIYDPEAKKEHIMVLTSEWKQVKKLPDDWTKTRKYFRKKR